MDIHGIVWHSLTESDALANAESSLESGLSAPEAARRKEVFGENVITLKKGPPPIILFLTQFNQPLVYILLAASLVTALLKEWADSSVIFGVVLVNAIIGFIQESKALKAIGSLAKSMISEVTVIRNGNKQRIQGVRVNHWRHRCSAVRRQGTGRPSAASIARIADRRISAYRRIRSGDQTDAKSSI